MASEKDEKSVASTPLGVIRLLDAIKGYYHTKEFVDLTIKHESSGRLWRVHKLVVCSHSDQLKATLETGAKFEGQSEKAEVVLDEDPQVIEAMLHYFYTGDYGDIGNSQVHVSPLLLNVRVFIAADKYFVPALSELAATKFGHLCITGWESPEFAESVKEIYACGPAHDTRVKDLAVKSISKHAPMVFDQNLRDKFSPLLELLGETAELGLDLSQKLATKMFNPKSKYMCPNNNRIFEIGEPAPSTFGCPDGCYGSQTSAWWASHKLAAD